MSALIVLLCLQAGPQDLVEQALGEESRSRRRALIARLRKFGVVEVEKAVRTRTYGDPKLERGTIVVRSSRTDHADKPFTYAVHIPEGYDAAKPWPLIVTLHGANKEGRPDAGEWWIKTWLRTPAAKERFIILAPTTTKHTWSCRPGHSLVFTPLRELMSELHIDPDRIYLDGMSMGAGGTFDLTENYPDRWAAIGPRCNVPETRRKRDGSFIPMLCENFRNVPVYWVLGTQDRSIPIEFAHPARDALKAMKYDLVYREHPEGNHDWGLEKDEVVLAWYETKVRNPYPEEVVWKTFEKAFPGAYWLEVKDRTRVRTIITVHMDMLGKESERRAEFRPPALVRARREGNRIDVTCQEVRELRIFLSDAMVDLDQPVKITVNDRTLYDRKVRRSVDFLIEEAIRRRDRAMTFSAYVDLKVR